MSGASRNPLNFNFVKTRHFVGTVGLTALRWIEATLAEAVLAARNDVPTDREEQTVRLSCAHLHDVFFKHVKGFDFKWKVCVRHLGRLAELAAKVVPPRKHLGVGSGPLLRLPRNCYCIVFAARNLLNLYVF